MTRASVCRRREVVLVLQNTQNTVYRMFSNCFITLLFVCISFVAVSAKPAIKLSNGCQCAIRKVISESGRVPCPRACGFNSEPVCGFNPCEEEHPHQMFRTFANDCELEATICNGPGNLYWRTFKGTCVMDHQDESSCLIL